MPLTLAKEVAMRRLNMICPSCQNSIQVPEDIDRLSCVNCGEALVVERGKGFATLRLLTPHFSGEGTQKNTPSISNLDPLTPINSSSMVKLPEKNQKRGRNLIVAAAGAMLLVCCMIMFILASSDGDKTDRTPETALSSELIGEATQSQNGGSQEASLLAENVTPTMTETPKPSETPTTTPTTTPTATPGIFVTVLQTANLRSGPGSDFPVVSSASQGEELLVIGRNNDGSWLQVIKDGPVWIWGQLIGSSEDLDSVPIPPTPTPTDTPTHTPTPNLIATTQAQAQMATSTARAQSIANATATVKAYADFPPIGTWCNRNSTRSVCVGNFEYRRSVGYTSAATNSRFIVFAVRVDNVSSGSISVNPFDVTFVLENGETFSHADETYTYSNYFGALTIASGDNAQGAIVFLVRNNVAPERVIYRGGFFESVIEINLKDQPIDN